VSVGVAQPDEHAATTPDDLLTRADSTMYTAKRLRKKLADVASREPPSGEFALSSLVRERRERRAAERKDRP
jgi:GGDEF domain-containing protein